MREKYRENYRLLGLRIAYYRKVRGYTQEQLAEMIGKSWSFLSQIEANNGARLKGLSLETLFPLPKHCRFRRDACLTRTEVGITQAIAHNLPQPPYISRTRQGRAAKGQAQIERFGPALSCDRVLGNPYALGAGAAVCAAAAASAAALALSACAFLTALYFSFSSGVAMGKMQSRGQTLVHILQLMHLA